MMDLGMLGKMLGLPAGGLPPIPCALCEPESLDVAVTSPAPETMATVVLGTPVCDFHAGFMRGRITFALELLNQLEERAR